MIATANAATRRRIADRYLTVPCENGLKVIWDRLEEQVVDVIVPAAARYAEEDLLWDEARATAEADAWSLAA